MSKELADLKEGKSKLDKPAGESVPKRMKNDHISPVLYILVEAAESYCFLEWLPNLPELPVFPHEKVIVLAHVTLNQFTGRNIERYAAIQVGLCIIDMKNTVSQIHIRWAQ